MSQGFILHVAGWNKKFILPFRDYIQKHFPGDRHKFIIYGNFLENEVPPSSDTLLYPSLLHSFLAISRVLHKADKIILHGLFNTRLFLILAAQPWLLRKCYWVIWGGDLYIHEATLKNWRWYRNELLRRFVIKRLGYLVTYVEGDADLARKWYQARGVYRECFVYTSNLYQDYEVNADSHDTITIQLGNSADPSNNHLEILERLLPFRDKEIAIYAPLSYGDQAYAKTVIDAGIERFGKKFIPITEFMPFNEYLRFLGHIDIAIFNHKRQQAMGNTITLLGLGKKMYLRCDTTSWQMLQKLGLKVFDINDIDLSRLDVAVQIRNQSIIINHFTEMKLLTQLKTIFDE